MLLPPAQFATRFAAATRKGGTIAYLVRSAGTSLPLGLRLASASGSNDRTLLPCNGTPGDDQMLGTTFADRMNSLGGADRIESGPGDDRIHGGTDRDLVFAGAGNDFISVRGGASDTVECGPGRDRVIADGRDVVADDCEAVQR
jgi:Ca2+-binding RTX toxin-like protein